MEPSGTVGVILTEKVEDSLSIVLLNDQLLSILEVVSILAYLISTVARCHGDLNAITGQRRKIFHVVKAQLEALNASGSE